MMTWRLWRALLSDIILSPMFRRTYIANRIRLSLSPSHALPNPSTRRFNLKERTLLLLTQIIAVLGGVGLLFGLLCLLPVLIALFALSGVFYGARCALETSHRVTMERENGTYSILCVTPPGIFGVHWSICTGYLRQYENFNLLRVGISRTSIGVVVFACGLVAISLLSGPRSVNSAPLESLVWLSSMIALVAAFYLNFVQSVIIGCMVGLLVPGYTSNKLDAQLYAVSIFLTLALASIALTLFVILSLDGAFISGGLGIRLLLPLVYVLVFYLIREAIITLLWNQVVSVLNTETEEVAQVLNPSRAILVPFQE